VNTNELIESLARGAGPAPGFAASRRLGWAACAGLSLTVLLCVALFSPIPREMLATPAPWIKLAYAGALGAAASWLVARLGRPVARLARPVGAVALVLVGMALAGVTAWLGTPVSERLAMLVGHTPLSCPTRIFSLSVPVLFVVLWSLRGLAPTRLRAAGLAAGLLAGALAALGYALVCRELSASFVAVWYSVGIALAAMLGAVLGPATLRW
jgi:hypothetical protein